MMPIIIITRDGRSQKILTTNLLRVRTLRLRFRSRILFVHKIRIRICSSPKKEFLYFLDLPIRRTRIQEAVFGIPDIGMILNVMLMLARCQKFAMEGLFWGSGGGAPQRSNFTFFCKNNLILGLF